MRKGCAMIVAAIVLCVATAGQAQGAEANTTDCKRVYGGQTWGPLIDRAYALRKWREEDPRTALQKRRIENHRRCARTTETRVHFRQSARRHRNRFNEYRDERLERRAERRALTPYDCGSHGRFAIPCYIVACESEYDKHARNSSSSAGGWYQIIDSTWYAYGGSRYSDSHPAAVAPGLEQHQVARRIYTQGGAGHWLCA